MSTWTQVWHASNWNTGLSLEVRSNSTVLSLGLIRLYPKQKLRVACCQKEVYFASVAKSISVLSTAFALGDHCVHVVCRMRTVIKVLEGVESVILMEVSHYRKEGTNVEYLVA